MAIKTEVMYIIRQKADCPGAWYCNYNFLTISVVYHDVHFACKML